MLDTSQLAFLTADPGVIQTKLADAITTYHKQKKTIHGVPSQMEEGQVWSRYMSEAAQLKVDSLQQRIKDAQEDLEAKQTINTGLMVPKSITLNDLHGIRSKRSMGQDLNVVLSIGSATSNLVDDA